MRYTQCVVQRILADPKNVACSRSSRRCRLRSATVTPAVRSIICILKPVLQSSIESRSGGHSLMLSTCFSPQIQAIQSSRWLCSWPVKHSKCLPVAHCKSTNNIWEPCPLLSALPWSLAWRNHPLPSVLPRSHLCKVMYSAHLGSLPYDSKTASLQRVSMGDRLIVLGYRPRTVSKAFLLPVCA